jgi:PAS domain S-box-containing protein
MKEVGLDRSRGKQRPADNSAARVGSEIARALQENRKTSSEQGDGSPNFTSIGFVTFTADGLIREINPSAVQLLSHHGNGMIGVRFVEFIANADRGKFLEHLACCRQNSEPTHPSFVELQLAHKTDEEPIFIELFSIPILEKQAGQIVYKSVFRNITTFKQMQKVHRWLAAIVEHSEDAILGLDLHGKIISCNKGALQLYGYAPHELIGQPVTILTPVELQDKETMILQRVRHGEVIDHYETVRQHKEGKRIDVSLSISPIKDAQGKIIGASKTARDVTERKRSESELVEILAREQAANRAKDDFLAALSHELRTPLSPVLLLASDAAHDPDLPPHIRKNFDTIRKNIELEARLIDDLLDLTRITRGKLVLNQSELDVHEILNDATLTVLNEIEQKQIVLKLELRAERHKIFGDAVRLQQIFWNVLKNAVKFSYEGQITIESQTLPGDMVLINITDTGIGMGPDEIEHIFGAFSQGKHHFGGLGLGLAISRALVELHSGAIRASSPGKGKGSTFSIELPLMKMSGKKETVRVQPAPKPIAVTGEASGQRLHILLAEDHEPTRLALTQLLLHRRYKVSSAGSLARARSLMEKNHDFHLLISDIGLPDGTGYELMREFQKKFGAKGIALTGYGMEQDIAQSEASGFTAHLTKPVRIELLENALAVVLNKQKAREIPKCF